MADQRTPAETPEEKVQREQQERDAQRQAQSSDSGITDLLMGFLKFLFSMFFPSSDAPNEDAGDANRPPVSFGEKLRLGKLILDKRAIPNWEAFQQAHKGEKVEFIDPVVGGFRPITRDMGSHIHPVTNTLTMHTGVDLKALVQGTSPDVVASAEGVVLFAGNKQGYGNTVILGHADGSYTLYGHLRDTPDENSIGKTVPKGAKIGVMGQSGDAQGIHLHYEQRKGTEALVPHIAEVGDLVNGVGSNSKEPPDMLARLADPSKHPKLAVGNGTPAPLAFAGVTSTSAARQHS